jgi:outer membrane protein OmpA-like peptidoglycan-associated protein
MKPNALVLALISTATALPGTANAADDICSRLIIYAITQFCQILPNGQNLCQPIGLARPDPTCNSPSANQVVQIPLGPPTIQAWPYAQFPSVPNTFVPNAYAQNTFVPNPLAANAFTPNSLTPNAYAPNAFAPNTFIPKQFASNPYLTYLYGQTPNGSLSSPAYPAAPSLAAISPDSVPSNAPVAPPAQAPTVVAAIKPEAIVEAAPMPALNQPIDKLMPETNPEAKPETKPESSPPVAAETALPPAAEKPVAEVVSTVEVGSTVVAAQPEPPAVVQMSPVPEAAPATLPDATIATVPASPVEPEAAKQAEVARVEAEKARQDALAHFEFDSAELTPVGRAMLDDWLKQASTNDPILVTGHADRLGPEPYNEKLSMLRAESVKKYLIEKGKPAKRIEIQAKGEKFPLISCSGTPTDATIACLAPNRRAEIVFKPSVRKAARTATKLIKPKSSR